MLGPRTFEDLNAGSAVNTILQSSATNKIKIFTEANFFVKQSKTSSRRKEY